MANLNLSEFTEKLFVTDADHTFIWDSAASISKRVSRNSWLNSGTLTSDAPVTISQTWNNAAVAFTGLKFNAAGTSGTNSAAASLLLDFQLNGVTQFSVTKAGRTKVGNIIDIGASLLSWENPYLRTYSPFSCAKLDIGAGGTVLLEFDAANTLALRNGAAAQTFNVYGTSSSNNTVYERMFAKYNTTDVAFQIGTETAGATLRPLDFVIGGTRRMMIGTTGNVGIGTNGAPVSTLELRKDAAINGPMMVIRSNVRVAGNWASISFGDDTQASAYRKGALIYESTSSSANGKFHIALNNDGTTADATLADARLTVLPSGNVGIGTTSPTSKLQVTNGDVEIETVTSGIIMKAAGTSTRYRITLNATGDALVFTAI